ncbi:hypothetical protein SAMN05892883_1687 [Jatrophihabitans sp. GAS493]|nr:hypothetical protein SAMN05892883_1687 [Jatrophihabitans sp. GAS493]
MITDHELFTLASYDGGMTEAENPVIEAVTAVRRASRAERDEQIAKELRNDERVSGALDAEETSAPDDAAE